MDGSSKTWEDGYTSGQCVNFGGKATVKKNALRFATDGPDDNIRLLGSQEEAKILNPGCYYVTGGRSVNSEGNEARAEWFVSLDTEAALAGGISRNADGSVNLNGFLSLTGGAPADVGAKLD